MPAGVDGFLGSRPQRIDHPDKPEEAQSLGLGRRVGRIKPVGQQSVCQRQHTEPGASHLLRYRATLFEHFAVSGVAHRANSFGRTLDKHTHASIESVIRRGEAVLGLKGDPIDFGVGVEHRSLMHAQFVRHEEQRDVGRIAVPCPLSVVPVQVGFIAECCNSRQVPQILPIRLGEFRRVWFGGSDGRVALSGDVQLRPRGQANLSHSQFVAGERSSLVAGDERATAQPFDGAKPAHDHTPAGHACACNREGHSDRDGQSLGDHRHRERNAENRHVSNAIPANHDAKHSDEHRRRDRCDADRARESLESIQKWWPTRRCAHHVDRQSPNARVRPRRDHDGFAPPANNGRAGVDHVLLVCEACRGCRVREPLFVFVDAQRFTRQERLVGLKRSLAEQAGVGRNAEASFEHDDIARHNLRGVDVDDLALAFNGRPELQEFAQGLCTALGTPFLRAADRGVHDEHNADESGVGGVPDCERQSRRGGEHDDERTGELASDDAPPRH